MIAALTSTMELAQNPPLLPEWRRNLTDKTAADVEAMCRRFLRFNPNNRFVREQYPQLLAVITAEQQEQQTTHQRNHHATTQG